MLNLKDFHLFQKGNDTSAASDLIEITSNPLKLHVSFKLSTGYVEVSKIHFSLYSSTQSLLNERKESIAYV